MVKEINTIQEYDNLLLKNEKVIVDFYSNGCEPCKKLRPIFEGLSEKYKNIIFCKINVENAEEIADKCAISNLPTLLFYKNSECVDEMIGFDIKNLENKINNLNHN